jgi:hypothetical protein
MARLRLADVRVLIAHNDCIAETQHFHFPDTALARIHTNVISVHAKKRTKKRTLGLKSDFTLRSVDGVTDFRLRVRKECGATPSDDSRVVPRIDGLLARDRSTV